MSEEEQKKIGLWIAGGVLAVAIVLLLFLPFLKARQAACRNACISNLCGIDAAKDQWALEYDKRDGDEVTRANCELYLKSGRHNYFACPLTKTEIYTIGKLDESPRCATHGSLEESRAAVE